MVPSPPPSESSNNPAESTSTINGGMVRDLNQNELYRIIQAAVKDALLDVIGTILLVVIAFVLVLTGAQVILSSIVPFASVIGIALVVAGLYLAGSSLEVIPPVRDWI